MIWIAGWSYADRFFAEFGLNLSTMDGLAQESILAYAVWVFRDGWQILLLCGLIVALIAASFLILWRPTAMFRLGLALMLVMLAAGGITGAARLGADRAIKQVHWLVDKGYQNFPRVVLSLKKDSAAAELLGEKATSTCLRKLFMDRKALYVYPGYESQKGKPPDVYILPLQDVQGIKVINSTVALCMP